MTNKQYIEKFGEEALEKKKAYWREWYNKWYKVKRTTPTLKEQLEIDRQKEVEITKQFKEKYTGQCIEYQDCLFLDNGDIYKMGGAHCSCKNPSKKVYKTFKKVNQTLARIGYLVCQVGCKCDYAHRHIWRAFNGDIPEGMEIDHIDTNRGNNNLSNLRLVSKKENRNNPLTKEHYRISNKGKITEKLREVNRARCLDPKRNPNRYLGNY